MNYPCGFEILNGKHFVIDNRCVVCKKIIKEGNDNE